ncbi:MAG: SpvB/TcaC N-terminal domain-containing protein, partial [Betaproteobacteria bacterium]
MSRARAVCFAAVIAALSPSVGHSQTTVAGFVSGSFQVAENGAASYSIPIQVPPGIGGLQPNLALVYNSHAGNGLMGMGWSLSGLPAVSRCGKTIAQDQKRTAVAYDGTDRYCFNGERLVGVAGPYGGSAASEYRTERESFTKFLSYGAAGGGPTSFQMQTKSGLWMEFGSSGNAKVEAVGKAAIRIYSLYRVRDASMNAINIAYNENIANGEYSPQRIDYAGNDTAGLTPVNSVRFVYETRPDKIFKNVAGSSLQITQRLKNIQTYAGANMVRDYRLAYTQGSATGRSRLTSVTVCNPAGTECFVAAQFPYSDHTAGGSQNTPGGQAQGAAGWRLADLFGDGRQVHYTHNGSGSHS